MGAERVSAHDIQVAAKACSLKHGDKIDLKPGFRDVIWGIRLRKSKRLLRREAQKLYAWIASQSQGPILWHHRAGGGGVSLRSGPSCLALACSLMSRGNCSMSEAWNTSNSEALWMDAAFAQIGGTPIGFLDEEMVSYDPVDISELTDADALAMLKNDLPSHLVEASFDHWKRHVKRRQNA